MSIQDMTDEQFAYCLYKEPWVVLKIHHRICTDKINHYYE